MNSPLVGIIMGSDSDLPVMREAKEILDSFGVANEITIVIAGAGGAAHLPGMVASLTALPVIGVPIKTKSLDGLDSLLSIAQMPPGVPVATMAINGARNAGILACQILGTRYSEVASRVEKYKRELNRGVLKKVRMLEESGIGRYKRKA